MKVGVVCIAHFTDWCKHCRVCGRVHSDVLTSRPGHSESRNWDTIMTTPTYPTHRIHFVVTLNKHLLVTTYNFMWSVIFHPLVSSHCSLLGEDMEKKRT